MLITQTPLRMSFLGGGTDYPAHFEEHGGAVLASAIDKSAFLSVSRFYSDLFDYSVRVSYRKVECVESIEELEHAPFRECLRWCGIERNVEVDYTAELPALTGLGSSSTFVVGLLNALHAYQGKSVRPLELAYQAIQLEREVLGEAVGCQDQVLAAVGGFNVIEFRATDDIRVHRIALSNSRLNEFQDHCMLFFTGIKRRAETLARGYERDANERKRELLALRKMVDEGHDILTSDGPLHPFGELLHRSWLLKKELTQGITNETIDKVYQEGVASGALGGKLLGAGGGGFLLFFVPPERQEGFRKNLHYLTEIPIRLNAPGTRVVHS